MNIFERAARKKLRFDTPKGPQPTEALFDIPLRGNNDFNLNTVARTVGKALKADVEEDYVGTTKTKTQTELELKLDIVKHVIDYKKTEEKRADRRVEIAAKRAKLYDAMARQEDSALEKMTPAQFKKELAALDAEEFDADDED